MEAYGLIKILIISGIQMTGSIHKENTALSDNIKKILMHRERGMDVFNNG